MSDSPSEAGTCPSVRWLRRRRRSCPEELMEPKTLTAKWATRRFAGSGTACGVRAVKPVLVAARAANDRSVSGEPNAISVRSGNVRGAPYP